MAYHIIGIFYVYIGLFFVVRESDLQAARDTGDSNKERLGRCEKLLGEGADLVGEGSELLTRVAADKDVVAN